MRYRLALFAIALCTGAGLGMQPARAYPATTGVGPNGYDFLIGTWTCKNKIPSPMGGPAGTSVAVTRSVKGTLAFTATGDDFSAMGYIVYDPKTKTWWNPSVAANGGYGTESTQQTGKKSVWSGTFVDPSSGKTTRVRSAYTFPNSTMYTDLYEINTGVTWKTEGNSTCTKG